MKKLNVKEALVYRDQGGYFRYTCRDAAGQILYESEQRFRSGHAARREIQRRWPSCRVNFGV
jgi:uncharacterized protein YegP (UPF0339 family)